LPSLDDVPAAVQAAPVQAHVAQQPWRLQQRLAGLQRQLQEAKSSAAKRRSMQERPAHQRDASLQKQTRLTQYQALMQAQLQKLHREQAELQALEQGLAQNLSASMHKNAAAFAEPRQLQEPQLPVTYTGLAQSNEALGTFQGSQQLSAAELQPNHAQCMPQCRYQCTNLTCDEECTPDCESPKCQTRCNQPDLTGCQMQCGQPHCSVVCPQRPGSRAQCTTHCSEPMCMLQCPKAQNCHSVCEQPQCSWKCRAPSSCPQPTCTMNCEAPSGCVGSTHRELPPLQLGEVAVQSFAAPAGFAMGVVPSAQAEEPVSLRGASEGASQSPATMTVPIEAYSQPQQLVAQIPVMDWRAQ